MLADPADQHVSMTVVGELEKHFGAKVFVSQSTHDGIPTLWIASALAHRVLDYLRTGLARPYRMLFDLTAIDEHQRFHRQDQPASDFTVVYHLLSYERNADVRIKVPLTGDAPALTTVTDLWAAANWYECEAWDMSELLSMGIRICDGSLCRRPGRAIPCARTIQPERRRAGRSSSPR